MLPLGLLPSWAEPPRTRVSVGVLKTELLTGVSGTAPPPAAAPNFQPPSVLVGWVLNLNPPKVSASAVGVSESPTTAALVVPKLKPPGTLLPTFLLAPNENPPLLAVLHSVGLVLNTKPLPLLPWLISVPLDAEG